ncbi:MAG: cytochrome c oxidase subunit II [Parvularculaceae bacterium]
MKKILSALSGLGLWAASAAHAQPVPAGVEMQPAATALAHEVHFFHNAILMPIITVISFIVLALLIWVMVRYNAKANPVARKFSHNTLVEIIWTGIPILILLAIAIPSFDLLFKEDVIPDGKQVVVRGDGQTVDFVFPNDFGDASRMVASREHLQVILDDGATRRTLKYGADYKATGWRERDLVVSLSAPAPAGTSVIVRGGRSTQNVSECAYAQRYFGGCEREVIMAPSMTLRVTGYQWNWQYAYPDFGDFDFFSNMLAEDQTTPELYRFAVDNHIVVPVGETVRVTTTANDVIHAFAVPAFAIKIDAVPGRFNETWFRAEKEGVYYGQCSEICGVKHSFMPIAVEVVSRPKFEAWVDSKRALAGLEPMFDADQVKLALADSAAAAAE